MFIRRLSILLALIVLWTRVDRRDFLCGVDPEKKSTSQKTIFFKTDIQPVIQAKCLRCHDEKNHKAELDLTTPESILKGGESGPVVIPGKPEASELYKKVHSGAMPPKKKDPLTESEVETIRRWIAEGAKSETGEVASTITQHDILPILLRRCTVCHGLHRQEANLDLRTKASMFRGGKSGPAITPGKPKDSLLIQKLRANQMPPRDRLVEAGIKLIEPSEIDLLEKWIAAGAPELNLTPDIASTTPDTLVTDKDRDFWAFRSPQPVKIPVVKQTERVRNPIDAFILQKLEGKNLSFTPEADRLTLLRRAYFDLTGLPPEPTEIKAFLHDSSPNAYEKMIDRLLASPRYGERWGTYWLDLAGYADSEGKREQDLPRPHAWRYRDYVIQSFNKDKPYTRFLLEQLAGDELIDYENAAEITEEIYNNLVATGFLRMVPDGTWANITGYIPDRLEVIADEIDVLGSSIMGLTLKCARCHTHKFDPLPHRDYYRLVDIFKGALDEYDWLRPDIRPGLGPISQDFLGGRHLPFVTTTERRTWEEHNGKIQKEIDSLQSHFDRKAEPLETKYLEEKLNQLPEVLRADLRTMLATPANKRDTIQKYLAEKFEKPLRIDRKTLKTLNPEFKKESDEIENRIRSIQTQKLPEPRVQALWDRGQPTPTYIYRRGDFLTPGRLVGPGVPSVLTDGKTPFVVKPPWPNAKKTGRRLAFAQWLIQPNHPLTARVAVNRLWKHHFGTGIVKSLGNFGKTGTPPTHPELLDWLAGEFVRQGWSMKSIHRLLMTSTTYRQSSNVTAEQEKLDPENVLLSRMPLVRLDAESLYDTLLLVAGRLNETQFGPADDLQSRPDGFVMPKETSQGWRRLLYVQHLRKQIPTHLETFDYPQMNPNCLERRDSIVAPQALHLMNSGMVHRLAEAFARRVVNAVGTDPEKQIEQVYLISMSRFPNKEEKQLGLETLAKLTDQWTKELASSAKLDQQNVTLKALTTYCRAIVNSAGFLYVD
jgi:hypothetical protein